jgi:hypothetical protein
MFSGKMFVAILVRPVLEGIDLALDGLLPSLARGGKSRVDYRVHQPLLLFFRICLRMRPSPDGSDERAGLASGGIGYDLQADGSGRG